MTTVRPSTRYPSCVTCECGAIFDPTGALDVMWAMWGSNTRVPGTIDMSTTCPGCGMRWTR